MELLQYHIDNTNKQFDEVKDKLHEINQRLDDVQKFKVEMLVSSRWISLVVSSVCGFFTLVATSILSYYVQLKLKGE